MERGGTRFYYGWIIVAIAFLVPMISISFTVLSFGLFVRPVSAEYALSRAEVNTGFIAANIGIAVFAPLIGRIADRARIKLLLPICALLVGGSLIVLGLSRSMTISLLVLAGPLAAGFVGSASLAGFVLIARWFSGRRGRAMAIAAIGQTFGGIALLPVVAKLIDGLGWRQTLMIEGATVIVVVCLLSLLVREHPEAHESDIAIPETAGGALGEPPSDRVWTIPMLMKSPLFWGINIAVAIGLAASQSLTTTLVPFGQEKGLSLLQATTLFSAITLSSIVGKLLLAVFSDKIEQRLLLAGSFVLMALMFVVLTFDHNYRTLILCCLVGGAAIGGLVPLLNTLIARVFGAKSFGTVMGSKAPIIAITSAIFVRFIGEVYDRTGGYDIAFFAFAALLLVATIVILFCRPRPTHRPAVVAVGI